MAAFAAVCALANAWACDSGSYKQTGLLHQWDAINNDGTGVHNANATVRKDLKGSLDLTLTSKGSWGDKWLNVAGDSAKGTSATESYRTIEIVFRTTVDSYGIVF